MPVRIGTRDSGASDLFLSEPFEASQLIRLIHSIQRRGGGAGCFGRYDLHCPDEACPWREFCVDWPLLTSGPEKASVPDSGGEEENEQGRPAPENPEVLKR